MRVVTNHNRVRGKQRLGLILSTIGLLIMLGSVVLLFRSELGTPGLVVGLIGLAIASAGTYHINRWVRPPLPEVILPDLLRRLDARHVLFNHVDGLPTPHLLLTPNGLVAIAGRRYEGPVRYDEEKGRWRGSFSLSRLYIRGLTAERLGDPTADLEARREAVKRWLAVEVPEIADQVPVEAMALFLASNAKIEGADPAISVAQPETVKRELRALINRHPALPRERYQQLRDALERYAQAIDDEEAAE